MDKNELVFESKLGAAIMAVAQLIVADYDTRYRRELGSTVLASIAFLPAWLFYLPAQTDAIIEDRGPDNPDSFLEGRLQEYVNWQYGLYGDPACPEWIQEEKP